MNPVVWFGLVLLGISAICFVADFFLKLGEDGGTSDGRGAAWGVDASSSLISGEGAGSSNAPNFDVDTDGRASISPRPSVPRVGSTTPSPELSFSEALKPVGGAPSWASVRREG